MQLEILGSGTSHGVPVIACDCETCKSDNPKDKRLRCSALLTDIPCQSDIECDGVFTADKEDAGHGECIQPTSNTSTVSTNIPATNILIDAGPEFRIQALRAGITHLDAVLLTHSHADHLHGIDDLRVFSCLRPKDAPKPSSFTPLKIYANENTIKDFTFRFDYIFKPITQGGGCAFIELIDTKDFSAENPLIINGIKIVPIPILHGAIPTNGYLFNKNGKTIVYLTDCNAIPDSSIDLIKSFGKIDVLVIDGLREKPHSTHFSFSESFDQAEKIAALHTYFTHICHDTKHEDIVKWLALEKEKRRSQIDIAPAYDGLVI